MSSFRINLGIPAADSGAFERPGEVRPPTPGKPRFVENIVYRQPCGVIIMRYGAKLWPHNMRDSTLDLAAREDPRAPLTSDTCVTAYHDASIGITPDQFIIPARRPKRKREDADLSDTEDLESAAILVFKGKGENPQGLPGRASILWSYVSNRRALLSGSM